MAWIDILRWCHYRCKLGQRKWNRGNGRIFPFFGKIRRSQMARDWGLDPEEPTISISSPALALLRQMNSRKFAELAKLAPSTRAGHQAAELIISFASYHLGLPRNLKSF